MSVDSWDPKLQQTGSGASISDATLSLFIRISQQEQLGQLAEVLTAEEQQRHASLMTLPQVIWEQAAGALPDREIYDLIRFFTMAEMQLSGWEAGDKSPVIWLNKILKARGKPLGKEQILWIKQHTRNRFLPHGPLL